MCSASSLFPVRVQTLNGTRGRDRRERIPQSRIFSNLCCRNSSLQPSRLTSQKHDKRSHLTNHSGKTSSCGKTRQRVQSRANQKALLRPIIFHARAAPSVRTLFAPTLADVRILSAMPQLPEDELTVAPPRPPHAKEILQARNPSMELEATGSSGARHTARPGELVCGHAPWALRPSCSVRRTCPHRTPSPRTRAGRPGA